MNIRITDLLDGYVPDEFPFADARQPSARRTEQLVFQRLGVQRHTRRPMRRVLLAAACAAILAAAALAGALGLRQLSRADLGVTDPASIPEYTEYDAPDTSAAAAGVCLISSFCAGKRLIAYAQVPHVTQDMADTYRAAWDTCGLSLWSCRAKPYSVWAEQLSYDAASQTALVRIELAADEALSPGEISVELCFDTLEDGPDAAQTGAVTAGPVFAAFQLPVSPSNALSAAPGLAAASSSLEESAVLQELSLDAGTLHVTLQAPTLERYLAERGSGSMQALVSGYFGESGGTPDLLDAQVAYRRSWNQAVNDLFAGAKLLLADGTEQPLSALFQNQTCVFSPAPEASQEEAGIYAFEAALSAPVSLETIRAISVSGQEILLAQ